MTERRTHCSLRRYRYCHTSTSWNLALDQISLPLYLLSGWGIEVGLKGLTPGTHSEKAGGGGSTPSRTTIILKNLGAFATIGSSSGPSDGLDSQLRC